MGGYMFKRRMISSDNEWVGAIVIIIAFTTIIGGSVAAWVTHIVVSIQTASWVLLVMGSLVFPIGIIHGIMAWLGAA